MNSIRSASSSRQAQTPTAISSAQSSPSAETPLIVRTGKVIFSKEQLEIVGSIIKSAFPIFVMLESVALIGAVDLEISGRISTAAQAAVGLGDQLLYLTSTAASGLSVATCAVAARYFGSLNLKRISTTIKSSVIVATICGIAAMLAGWVAAHQFVCLLSVDENVINCGTRYIQLCALGSLPYVLSIVLSSIFRSIGKTAESLYSSISTAVVAICLSYLLFEFGPWKGSLDALCMAWVIAAYVGLIISLLLLKKHLNNFVRIMHGQERKNSFDKLHERKNSLRLVKLLFLIGAAVVLAESSTLATDFLVYKLLSMLDGATNLQAAWTIFLKVEETFAIMPISALSLAFAATVGQMIGQGRVKQARQCLQLLMVATSIFSAVIGTMLIAAPQVMAMFTHATTDVFTNAKEMVSLLPILFPLLAIRLLAFSFMEGAGQTAVPMKLSLAGNAIKLSMGALLMNVMMFGSFGLIFSILTARCFIAVGSIMALKATARIENPGD